MEALTRHKELSTEIDITIEANTTDTVNFNSLEEILIKDGVDDNDADVDRTIDLDAFVVIGERFLFQNRLVDPKYRCFVYCHCLDTIDANDFEVIKNYDFVGLEPSNDN